ncbi:MAG: HU family DNA-binding protein [Patescibacteria group bacterium]
MNKADLINTISGKTNVSRKDVEEILDTFEKITIEAIKGGDDVTLTGFISISARQRSARMGVNPQNPTEKIQIPAVVVPKFKAGKALKDALKS